MTQTIGPIGAGIRKLGEPFLPRKKKSDDKKEDKETQVPDDSHDGGRQAGKFSIRRLLSYLMG